MQDMLEEEKRMMHAITGRNKVIKALRVQTVPFRWKPLEHGAIQAPFTKVVALVQDRQTSFEHVVQFDGHDGPAMVKERFPDMFTIPAFR